MAGATVLTRGGVAALCALLIACTPGPGPQPSFTPPRWTTQAHPDVPAKLVSLGVEAAIGWDGGLLVAGELPEPALFLSTDGRQWVERSLPHGVSDHLRGQPFAAHGPTAYALGSVQGRMQVWRTEDGTTWERTPLPFSDGDQSTAFATAIAAGPRGVLVARADQYDHGVEPGAAHSPRDSYGFEFWHSADGRVFRHAGTLPLAREAGFLMPAVVATHDGFLLHDSDAYAEGAYRDDTPMYRSEDGEDWEHIGEGLPIGSRLAAGRTGDLTFVLGDARGSGLDARYRRDGERSWRSGSIDLGILPDAGVRPRGQQRVTLAHPWNGGFLAAGTTTEGERCGLVWTSPDGITWTRVPVRDNGFDQDVELAAVASSRGTTVLVGMVGIWPDHEVRIWRAGGS